MKVSGILEKEVLTKKAVGLVLDLTIEELQIIVAAVGKVNMPNMRDGLKYNFDINTEEANKIFGNVYGFWINLQKEVLKVMGKDVK